MILIKRILLFSIATYFFGNILALSLPEDCWGWQCEYVTCPEGYAVLVPGKGYLKCEDVEKYLETLDNSLITKISR